MENLINIEEALGLDNVLFIDLRSPCEYEEAHIPGALNLPLMEDDERAMVGTIYKQESPEKAVDRGFAIIAPKLPRLTQQLKQLTKERTLVLYCWRGGMRSKSLCQVLHILGIKHYRLIGGYKAFRHYVNDFFAKPFEKEIVVLHGLTGVGKTEILQHLIDASLPAIDLEGLANNRGSVFGHIGMRRPPSQKQFEGMLFCTCRKLQGFPRIAVECESRRIGSIFIPLSFFQAMQKGRKVLIYDSLENRITRLINTYLDEKSTFNEEQLAAAINNLKKRLGSAKVEQLLALLKTKDYHDVVEALLLDYYDPLYKYPDQPSEAYELNLNAAYPEMVLEKLKEFLIR
ncbi:MAG: tRNA 2-selenouridine(34) synthase MnmH [Bacillota bacterium]